MHYTNGFVFALAALSNLAPTLALPTSDSGLAKRTWPAANTQSCHAKDNGAYASYAVQVGIPYNSGSGCNDIYNAINGCLMMGEMRCQDNGQGGTQLFWDNVINQGACINAGLHRMYPTVNNFNCPDS